MKALLIKGDRVYLRRMCRGDANSEYLSWLRDPEVTRYLEIRDMKYTLPLLRRYVSKTISDEKNLFLAVILKKSRLHIGNIRLGPIDRQNSNAAIGVMIGAKQYWGKGYGTEAVGLVVRYAFDKLKLHRVYAGCLVSNVNSARLFEKLGFVREAIFRQHRYYEGRFVDVVQYGRLVSEYKAPQQSPFPK